MFRTHKSRTCRKGLKSAKLQLPNSRRLDNATFSPSTVQLPSGGVLNAPGQSLSLPKEEGFHQFHVATNLFLEASEKLNPNTCRRERQAAVHICKCVCAPTRAPTSTHPNTHPHTPP